MSFFELPNITINTDIISIIEPNFSNNSSVVINKTLMRYLKNIFMGC